MLGNVLQTLWERTARGEHLEAALQVMKNASDVYLVEARQTQHEEYFSRRIEEIEAAYMALKS
jgi:hypothetical protein